MTTRTPHPNRQLIRALSAVAAVLAAAATLAPAPTPALASTHTSLTSYGWPVKPFNRQHPVRGSFGDPRILDKSHSFHFGVDVSCPDGTPVYATISGRATISPSHPEVVSILSASGRRRFGYWHITPAIRSGQQVVAYQTVIGTVRAPWAHVHFSEQLDGSYVNPLRSGAMGPFRDTTVPTVRSLAVEANGRVQRRTGVHGSVDLVAEAYDRTPISIAGAWHGKPLTPALIEWRLVDGRKTIIGWRAAVDFRRTYPSNELWTQTYARWTRQNKKIWNARYRFYLAHGLDTRKLHDGSYRVEIRATDIRGNTGNGAFAVTVVNSL